MRNRYPRTVHQGFDAWASAALRSETYAVLPHEPNFLRVSMEAFRNRNLPTTMERRAAPAEVEEPKPNPNSNTYRKTPMSTSKQTPKPVPLRPSKVTEENRVPRGNENVKVRPSKVK